MHTDSVISLCHGRKQGDYFKIVLCIIKGQRTVFSGAPRHDGLLSHALSHLSKAFVQLGGSDWLKAIARMNSHRGIHRFHAHNSPVGKTTSEQIRMDDLCQNLQAVYNAWSRTAEVSAAIHCVDPTMRDRSQPLPASIPLQYRRCIH